MDLMNEEMAMQYGLKLLTFVSNERAIKEDGKKCDSLAHAVFEVMLGKYPKGEPLQATSENQEMVAGLLALMSVGQAQGQKEYSQLLQATANGIHVLCHANHFDWVCKHYADLLISEWEKYCKDCPKLSWAQLYTNLSGAFREYEGSKKSLEYLRKIDPFMRELPREIQGRHRFNLGNSLKDLGHPGEAIKNYQLALSIGQELNDSGLINLSKLQIARYYRERGDNEKSDEFLKQVEGETVNNATGNYRSLYEINIIKGLINRGDFFGADKEARKLFKNLPDPPDFRFEQIFFSFLGEMAKIIGLLSGFEYSSRLSVIASFFTPIIREKYGAFSQLGLSLSFKDLGVEALLWFALYQKHIERSNEEIGSSVGSANLGSAAFFMGLRDMSINEYKKGIKKARQLKDGSLPALLAQYSLANWFKDRVESNIAAREALELLPVVKEVDISKSPHPLMETLERKMSGKSIDPMEALRKALPDFGIQQQSLGQHTFLVARELLDSDPEDVEDWARSLRRSQQRMGGKSSVLQKILDIRGDHINRRSSHLRLIVEYGYLAFIRKMFNLNSNYIREWILEKKPHSHVGRRILIESIVNPTGFPEASFPWWENEDEKLKSMPAIRAEMIKFVFYEEFVQEFPLSPIAGEIQRGLKASEARLRKLYGTSRKSYPLDLTLLKSSHPGIQLGLGDKLEIERDKHRYKIPWTDWDKEEDGLNSFVHNLPKFMDMGETFKVPKNLRRNFYLERELFAKLEILKDNSLEKLPVFIQYHQCESKGWLCIFDLDDFNFFSSSKLFEIGISSQLAKEIRQEWLAKIRMVERGSNLKLIERNTHLESIQVKIQDELEPGRKLILSLSEELSSIPIEQIPFGGLQISLMEYFQISRPPYYNRWLGVVKRSEIDLDNQDDVYVGGIPERQSIDERLKESDLNQIAALFKTVPSTGKRFSTTQILRDISGKSIIHILCHGESFQIHGETGFPVIETEDGFLLGHEISRLDLRSVNLAVISACKSGYGRNVGSTKIETMASFFLEAGVQTVVAATTLLNATISSQVLIDFYQFLLNGDSVGLAATKAFGKKQREKYSQEMFSWVIYGDTQPLKFIKHET